MSFRWPYSHNFAFLCKGSAMARASCRLPASVDPIMVRGNLWNPYTPNRNRKNLQGWPLSFSGSSGAAHSAHRRRIGSGQRNSFEIRTNILPESLLSSLRRKLLVQPWVKSLGSQHRSSVDEFCSSSMCRLLTRAALRWGHARARGWILGRGNRPCSRIQRPQEVVFGPADKGRLDIVCSILLLAHPPAGSSPVLGSG